MHFQAACRVAEPNYYNGRQMDVQRSRLSPLPGMIYRV